jgi:ABC-type dipeptide/oligopeptide/nickel transport system permease component
MVPVGMGVIFLVGFLIHLVPGDPADALLGEFATFEDKQALRESLGLTRPLWEQTLSYLTQVITGNLGVSFIYQRPVLDLIWERAGPTCELALTSLLVALLISFPLGILSAVKKDTVWDFLATGLSLMGAAIPSFWLGPLLIWALALKLDLLPVSERGGILTYILPSITIGTHLAAILSRMIRASLLDQLKTDYVRTARAKGVPERGVVLKHALSNALIPVITILGLQFGVLLTGAVITEKIFDWPGLGSLILEGLGNRDYPLVQGCILVFSGTYLFVNLLTDLTYALVDPRISWEEGA